jgi:hypothetical protein
MFIFSVHTSRSVVKKHIFVMLLMSFTVIQNRCHSVAPKPGDQVLFEAIMAAKQAVGATKGNENEQLRFYKAQILHALHDLEADPSFVTWMPGSRSRRQFNALNFAVRWYHEQHDDEILRAVLNPLCPKEFTPLLDYEDEFDHLTPRAMVQELFKAAPEECLGGYIKRTHFNSEDDELGYAPYFKEL